MPDAHANFAYSTVATAPSPATSGTSLVVAAGTGTRFPAVPFNATVWPVGAIPLSTNAEIVRVTGVSTDTLTITRAQESTSARTVVVGDQIAATITAKTLTDAEIGVWSAVSDLANTSQVTAQSLTDSGLIVALTANARYELEAILNVSVGADTAGAKYGFHFSTGSGGFVRALVSGTATSTAAVSDTTITAVDTASGTALLTFTSGVGNVFIRGHILAPNADCNLTLQHLKVTSGTSNIVAGSALKVRRTV